jgi:hypothetical protein
VLNTNCTATDTTGTLDTAGTCSFAAVQNNTATATFK